jgi:hypothetical protein
MPGDMEKVTGGLSDRSGGTGQKSGTLVNPLQPAYRLCSLLVTLLQYVPLYIPVIAYLAYMVWLEADFMQNNGVLLFSG